MLKPGIYLPKFNESVESTEKSAPIANYVDGLWMMAGGWWRIGIVLSIEEFFNLKLR